MDYINTFEKAGDDLIGRIRAAQDRTVDAIERIGKAVGGFKVPMQLPVDLPRPREIAEPAFRFWLQLAESQKEFTLKLLDALEPCSGNGKKTA
jgi:hypothetical protein